ncbi:MAG: NACHT domain-containing protein [Candidatus Omnitrophica bacterium]|nr:NACHT domain-containing protein [Candidatus Omnitrophota bacterium]
MTVGFIIGLILFRVTDKAIDRVIEGGLAYIGEKTVDILGQPIWKWLENALSLLNQNDEANQRWQQFQGAFAAAQNSFIKHGSPSVVEANLQRVFNLTTDIQALTPLRSDFESLADQIERFATFEQANIPHITDLCIKIAQHQGFILTPRHEVETAVTQFLHTFQDQLFLEPLYREWLLDQALWKNKRPPITDNKNLYLRQITERYQDIEFVGIPDFRKKQPVRLQSVFVPLRIESIQDNSSITSQNIYPEPKIPYSSTYQTTIKQVLKENLQVVILGNPGTGKTTLLRFIVLAFAQNRANLLELNEERLPILINLHDFVSKKNTRESDYSLLDYLNTHAKESLSLELPSNFFRNALDQQQCCVCFDGLDELGTIGDRHNLVKIITSFMNRFTGNRFLLTSRIVGYDEASISNYHAKHFSILPLNEEEITEFVGRWYEVHEKDVARAKMQATLLLRDIFFTPRIHSLAKNPLLLTIIALIHKVKAILPHERVKLYADCITALTTTRDQARQLDIADINAPHFKQRERLLEQLAYWMQAKQDEGGRVIEIKQGALEQKVASFLSSNKRLRLDQESSFQEAKAFISFTKARTGLLIEHGQGRYKFVHPTFQEFLAARDIFKRCVTGGVNAFWEIVKEHLHDPIWREVLLLLFGHLNDYDEISTTLVQKILRAGDQDKFELVFYRHLFFCGKVLGDRVELDHDLETEIIERLLNIINKDSLASYEAINILAALGENNQAINGLIALVKNSALDERIKVEIGNAFLLEGNLDGVRIFINLSLNSQVSLSTRINVIEELIEWKAHLYNNGEWKNHLKTALLLLEKEEELSTKDLARMARLYAILSSREKALALMKNVFANSMGLDFLPSKYRSENRDYIHEALQKIQEPNLLISLVEEGGNWDFWQWGFNKIKAVLEEANQADKIANTLIDLASDKNNNSENRLGALEALTKIKHFDEVAFTQIENILNDEQEEPLIRIRSINSLLQWHGLSKSSLSLHSLAINNKLDKESRSLAAYALGIIGQNKVAQDILLALLREPDANDDDEPTTIILDYLIRLSPLDEQLVEILIQIATDKNIEEWSRYLICAFISKSDFKARALQVLEDMRLDSDLSPFVRADVSVMLFKTYDIGDAKNTLLALVTDDQTENWQKVYIADELLRTEHQAYGEQALLSLIKHEGNEAIISLIEAGLTEKLTPILWELAEDQKQRDWERNQFILHLINLGEMRRFGERQLKLLEDPTLPIISKYDIIQSMNEIETFDEATLQILLEIVSDFEQPIGLRSIAKIILAKLLPKVSTP